MRQSEYNTMNLIVIFHVALFHGSGFLYLEIFHYLGKNKVKVKVNGNEMLLDKSFQSIVR